MLYLCRYRSGATAPRETRDSSAHDVLSHNTISAGSITNALIPLARTVMHVLCTLSVSALMLSSVPVAAATEPSYEIGGPLAGVVLPLFPTQHGEPAGYPGCLPGRFANDHLAPLCDLYPGSVEQYRAYMSKYMPIRSLFDRQSQLRNWTAPDMPGADSAHVEQYAAPLYYVSRFQPAVNTGKKLAPVPVVRCSVGSPVIRLDLGELPVGLYAVRVIGAVPTEKLRPFREPLFLALRVNDGLHGEVSTYRVRIGYVDDFYSVAELYFHAVEPRHFQAELYVDRGSTVDLLVHNISLDDVLAGSQWRPIKTRRTLYDDEAIAQLRRSAPAGLDAAVRRVPSYTPEQRRRRDEAIWKWTPPINAQGMFGGSDGAAARSAQQSARANGVWEAEGHREGMNLDSLLGVLQTDPDTWDAFIINRTLGLRYTIDDLWARKPLPDPYPYKDDGAGLYVPDPNNPDGGSVHAPIAVEVHRRLRRGPNMRRGAEVWIQTGREDFARDAAIDLVRFAYQYPTIDTANFLDAVVRHRGFYGRAIRNRQRETVAHWRDHYQNYLEALYTYDLLFPYIQGNQELASAIGRFVPWVRKPDDVIMLLDVYLVQHQAKRIMRYHDHTLPMAIATVATTLGDAKVTEPWMEWFFDRTFVYPLRPAGIQDLLISGCDRCGAQYIGSTYYAQQEGGLRTAAALEPYLRAGGLPRFDLGDTARYPKALAHCDWQFNVLIAGLDFCRIGDVTGPDKPPGYMFRSLEEAARYGWTWSKDPRFAWMLRHVYGRGGETDEQWAANDQAAGRIKRAPWLDLHSRVLPNWAGILETGHTHDDFRFRRAAYLRVGLGTGHAHNDTLDLQVVAHGMPATVDGGQRSGYSKPNDRFTRIHNVVEVDGRDRRAYAWVRALNDPQGARQLVAESSMPGGLFRREIALIDVDEGAGSQPLPLELQRPGAKLPAAVKTANSYVFDVCRVAGGRVHTYCFHGPVNDDFEWNAGDVERVDHVKATDEIDTPAHYLSIFEAGADQKFAGTAPDVLEATWRQIREQRGRGFGSEPQMLGANFDPSAPRRFTRLHLFDAAGSRAMRAQLHCREWGYEFTCLMAQHRARGDKPLNAAYAALVEPFVGRPFIESRRSLDVQENEPDALRVVAVEVKTTNGRNDLCFSDGRPERRRSIEGGFTVAGEFAYYSTDAGGLRQATLAGGTMLAGPHVRITVDTPNRRGRVVAVDYLNKTLTIDSPWPTRHDEQVLEIGLPGRLTAYTATRVEPHQGTSTITLRRGADYYRSRIERLLPEEGRIDCRLELPLGQLEGFSRGLVASNDGMTKFWRAEHLGGNQFRLYSGPGATGDAVAESAFAPEGVLRLWEMGTGDEVRRRTGLSLRRVEADVYAVSGDVDAVIALKATAGALSTDRQDWSDAGTRREGEWLYFHVPLAQTPGNAIYLRVTHSSDATFR